MTIEEFIDEYVDYLSRKYGVSKPKWEFSEFLISPASYSTERETIDVSFFFKKTWDYDIDRSKDVLRHSLAHEFKHHQKKLKGIRFPLPVGSRLWNEEQARVFALKESGILHRAAMRTWWRMLGELGF